MAEIAQTSFVDAAPYQQHLLDKPDPAQSLDYIRNFFASRNANPAYYPVAIQFAFLLAQDLQRTDPASPSSTKPWPSSTTCSPSASPTT